MQLNKLGRGIKEWWEDRPKRRINYLFLGIIFGFFICFRYIAPFGYYITPVNTDAFYQYQTISKGDINLVKMRIPMPWDPRPELVSEYDILYSDFARIGMTEYLKKHPVTNVNDIGEQIVLSNPDGELLTVINGRLTYLTVPVIKAKKVEVCYSGYKKAGNVLDTGGVYLNVVYENGDVMQYSTEQLSILDTEDLILKRGYNNFRVCLAGDEFLLTVLCEE